MKAEEQAWRDLQAHAARQLPAGFAGRVVRIAQGPSGDTWRQFLARGAAQIRPGFAERVLRAARNLPGVPSFLDQFAFSIGTAALCAVIALYVHSRNLELESERNLASWQQIAMYVEDVDTSP
jgi:hypothetical protein